MNRTINVLIPAFLLTIPHVVDAESLKRMTALAIDKGGINSSLAIFNGEIFFTAYDSANSIALWKFDGDHLEVVKSGFRDTWEHDAGKRAKMPALYSGIRRRLCTAGDRVYFTADDGTHGQELWEYDGQHVHMVADICQGPSDSNPNQLTPCDNELYFVATIAADEWLKPTVCRFAGNGVTPIKPDSSITWGLDVRDMTAHQGAVYFWAYHDQHGVELWKCKGQEIGMVENYCPDDRLNLLPDILTEYKGTLYLQTSGPTHCADLCKLQGGDKIAYISDLGKNCLSIPRPRLLGMLSDTLYVLVDMTHRKSNQYTSPPLYETREIWRFDGGSMRQSTVLEKNERVSNDRFYSKGAELNGYLYFGYGDADHGGELWRTDAKQAVLHADIWKGDKGSNPDEFLLLNGKLFFLASDADNGRQLWRLSAE